MIGSIKIIKQMSYSFLKDNKISEELENRICIRLFSFHDNFSELSLAMKELVMIDNSIESFAKENKLDYLLELFETFLFSFLLNKFTRKKKKFSSRITIVEFVEFYFLLLFIEISLCLGNLERS